MTNTPTLRAVVDGEAFAVELHRVSGWDAICYRKETGEALDPRIDAMVNLATEAEAAGVELPASVWPLADRALLAWLWYRQNPDQSATVEDITSEVTMIPTPAADDPAAGTDAPGAT